MSYIWDVTDPTGKRVNRITGEEVVTGQRRQGPWAALTPQVAQSIAGKAASSFVAWLPSQSAQAARRLQRTLAAVGVGAQPAAAAPPPRRQAHAPPPSGRRAGSRRRPTTGSIGRDGTVTALVPAVTGAPGDGSKSLTAAIQRELPARASRSPTGPTAVAYRVEGTVTVGRGQARASSRSRSSGWCSDPQGKKLGTVSQKNEIPEGSLDGAWGKTAEQAAGAAAQGIVKLLPQPKAIN